MLSFDKDDDAAMLFVYTCAVLRCQCFSIDAASLTLFEAKEMAGNIIPAIATTNAIIAGTMVLQGLKIIKGLVPSEVDVSEGRATSRMVCAVLV